MGAQPSAKFEELINEQMAKAEKMVAEGTAAENVYASIIKDGKGAQPLERILAPTPTADNPSKGGPPNAPVVIQMFADFQCPYCKRAQETIAQIVAQYPKKVRVVWRHKPLPFHTSAQLAAEASVEAFRQKGDAGFWAFSAKLFEAQSVGTAIDLAGIEQIAGEVRARRGQTLPQRSMPVRIGEWSKQTPNLPTEWELVEHLGSSSMIISSVGHSRFRGSRKSSNCRSVRMSPLIQRICMEMVDNPPRYRQPPRRPSS